VRIQQAQAVGQTLRCASSLPQSAALWVKYESEIPKIYWHYSRRPLRIVAQTIMGNRSSSRYWRVSEGLIHVFCTVCDWIYKNTL
jgi:hypothetical protein